MTRILMALAVLALAFSPPAIAQSKAAGGNVEKSLMQIEQELLDAIVKNDVAKIDRYMAPTFVFVGPDASVQDRAQWMADLKAGALKIESSKNDEMKVRIYGNSAVVTYRSTDKGSYKGNDITGQYRWTDVFVKQGGRWQIVSTHGTQIPPPKK